jgi:tRNA G26 N,N-dimethylase Trm1
LAVVNSAKSKHTQVTVRSGGITKALRRAERDRVIKEIQDMLRALYPTAVCRFMDKVTELFTEENLCGPGGPLSIISPQFVGDLTDEEVTTMVGESMRRRRVLTGLLDRLQRALDFLKEVCFSATSIPYSKSANKRRRLETRESSPGISDENVYLDSSEDGDP